MYIGYVYLTTNMINGKKYIGQHTQEDMSFIDSYVGSGKLIKRAILKYGLENFKKEILHYCKTREELNRLETEEILKHNAIECDNYYNIKDGGSNGNPIAGFTKEEYEAYRKKCSNSHKTKWATQTHHMVGK